MVINSNNSIIIILLALFCASFPIKAQNIEVRITGIRSTKGQIIIGIYKDEKSFRDDSPFTRKKFKKKDISKGEMMVKLNLVSGTYGFALLDDENDNDEMNYSIIGIPKEGFGFSDYYHSTLKRPKFDDFKFTVSEDQTKKILVKIKYML